MVCGAQLAQERAARHAGQAELEAARQEAGRAREEREALHALLQEARASLAQAGVALQGLHACSPAQGSQTAEPWEESGRPRVSMAASLESMDQQAAAQQAAGHPEGAAEDPSCLQARGPGDCQRAEQSQPSEQPGATCPACALLQQQCIHLQQALNAEQAAKDAVSGSLHAALAQQADLAARAAAAEAECTRLKGQLRDLSRTAEQRLAQQAAQLAGITAAAADLQHSVLAAHGARAAVEQHAQDLMRAACEQNRSLHSMLATAAADKQAAEAAAMAAPANATTAQHAMSSVEARLASVQGELDSAREALVASQSQVAEREAELAAMQAAAQVRMPHS